MNKSHLNKIDLAPSDITGEIANGIGLVAPFDFVLDDECRRWLPDGVPMFVTRTPELHNPNVTVDLAQQVSSELAVAPAVGSLMAASPAAIGYACTSGSFVDGVAGEHHLRQIMDRSGSRRSVTTSSALLEALNHLGVTKLSVVTPYNQELSQLLVDYLAESDISVVTAGYLDQETDIARINQAAIRRSAESVNHEDAEAVFFSCTNLHTFDLISQLEADFGKPVLSANQVTMWATLRQAGFELPKLNQRLFSD